MDALINAWDYALSFVPRWIKVAFVVLLLINFRFVAISLPLLSLRSSPPTLTSPLLRSETAGLSLSTGMLRVSAPSSFWCLRGGREENGKRRRRTNDERLNSAPLHPLPHPFFPRPVVQSLNGTDPVWTPAIFSHIKSQLFGMVPFLSSCPSNGADWTTISSKRKFVVLPDGGIQRPSNTLTREWLC